MNQYFMHPCARLDSSAIIRESWPVKLTITRTTFFAIPAVSTQTIRVCFPTPFVKIFFFVSCQTWAHKIPCHVYTCCIFALFDPLRIWILFNIGRRYCLWLLLVRWHHDHKNHQHDNSQDQHLLLFHFPMNYNIKLFRITSCFFNGSMHGNNILVCVTSMSDGTGVGCLDFL